MNKSDKDKNNKLKNMYLNYIFIETKEKSKEEPDKIYMVFIKDTNNLFYKNKKINLEDLKTPDKFIKFEDIIFEN